MTAETVTIVIKTHVIQRLGDFAVRQDLEAAGIDVRQPMKCRAVKDGLEYTGVKLVKGDRGAE